MNVCPGKWFVNPVGNSLLELNLCDTMEPSEHLLYFLKTMVQLMLVCLLIKFTPSICLNKNLHVLQVDCVEALKFIAYMHFEEWN